MIGAFLAPDNPPPSTEGPTPGRATSHSLGHGETAVDIATPNREGGTRELPNYELRHGHKEETKLEGCLSLNTGY
jgi:hypothetical protein